MHKFTTICEYDFKNYLYNIFYFIIIFGVIYYKSIFELNCEFLNNNILFSCIWGIQHE